jgi:hypothetical protein
VPDNLQVATGENELISLNYKEKLRGQPANGSGDPTRLQRYYISGSDRERKIDIGNASDRKY